MMKNREATFNLWLLLKNDIQMIATIAQNEMLITEEDLANWLEQIDKFKLRFGQALATTLNNIELDSE